MNWNWNSVFHAYKYCSSFEKNCMFNTRLKKTCTVALKKNLTLHKMESSDLKLPILYCHSSCWPFWKCQISHFGMNESHCVYSLCFHLFFSWGSFILWCHYESETCNLSQSKNNCWTFSEHGGGSISCHFIFQSDILADSVLYFIKWSTLPRMIILILCQEDIHARIQMALIELEVVWKHIVLILCLRFKKDTITSA